ncbi:sulfur carrier protein ThiS [Acetobacterium sp.]|uniref:sulfur carrier protein ThiS n=1 Tax=Acetobacterium sp. TaxID=1872094 RepID=UPI002F3F7DF2
MKVNGEDQPINDNQNLLGFLESNQYDITKIAVERNGQIIPKLMYHQVNLKDNDALEIVSFVGGG